MFFLSPQFFSSCLIVSTVFFPNYSAFASVKKNPNKIRFYVTERNARSQAQELYLEGMKLFNKHQYDSAITKFKAALAIDPNYINALNGIGISLGQQQKYPEAIAIFNQIIVRDRSFYNAYFNRGHIYQRQGKHNLALEDFNLVLKKTSNRHVSALMNRALIYIGLQNYERAKKDLDRVIEIKPQEATAYYNRALINATLGNLQGYNRDLEMAEKFYRAEKNISGVRKIQQVRESLSF